jgi:hypothetical protein
MPAWPTRQSLPAMRFCRPSARKNALSVPPMRLPQNSD